MIQANELRIGNWVIVDDMPAEQVTLQTFCTLKHYPFHLGKFQPIPLTPEILERCGFIKDSDNVYVSHKCLYWIQKNESEGILQIALNYAPLFNAPCNHVHQLQNIAFALTGKELEITL